MFILCFFIFNLTLLHLKVSFKLFPIQVLKSNILNNEINALEVYIELNDLILICYFVVTS